MNLFPNCPAYDQFNYMAVCCWYEAFIARDNTHRHKWQLANELRVLCEHLHIKGPTLILNKNNLSPLCPVLFSVVLKRKNAEDTRILYVDIGGNSFTFISKFVDLTRNLYVSYMI